jgi:hypothetical protein
LEQLCCQEAQTGKGVKRGTKKARIHSFEQEDNQEEEEDEAEFTEDGAGPSNGKGNSSAE